MSESKSYENKAHRAAVLTFKAWPGWNALRDELQYAAYFIHPVRRTCVVFAYSPVVMRPSGWHRLCNPIKYKKISGLFEGVVQYQELKKQGKLTEFGKAPSLRGPRKQYNKSVEQEDKKRRANDDGSNDDGSNDDGSNDDGSNDDGSNDDGSNDDDDSEGEKEVECQDSEECQDSDKPKLNYDNLEELALRFHTEHAVASDQLEDTLAAMYEDGWRFAPAVLKDMQRAGLPAVFYAQFTARVRGGTVFTSAFFRDLRAPDFVETRGPRPQIKSNQIESNQTKSNQIKKKIDRTCY
jgi:hypothetical protein